MAYLAHNAQAVARCEVFAVAGRVESASAVAQGTIVAAGAAPAPSGPA